MNCDLRQGDALAELLKIAPSSVGLVVFSPPYNIGKAYDGYDDQRHWADWYDWMRLIIMASYQALETGGTLAINVPTVVRWQREHRFANSWSSYDPAYSNHVGTEKMLGKARTEPVAFRLYAIMESVDAHMREPLVWVKGGQDGEAIANGYQMGCDSDPFLRSAHEMILLGSKQRWFHRGGTGRRGNEVMPDLDIFKDVWFVPGESSVKHPAPFPVEIPRRLIKAFTHALDALVVDPFVGIGSSAVAAVEAKRPFIGIDQSAHYLKIAHDRAEGARYEQGSLLEGWVE